MIEYSMLVSTVQERSGAADTAEAKRATQAVVAALSMAVDESTRNQLAECLPGQLREFTEFSEAATPGDAAALIRTVADVVGSSVERSRYYAHAVLSTLAEAAPDLARQLRQQLPGADDLLAPVGEGVAPRGTAVPAGLTPELLDQEQLDRELATLPGWEGDEQRLRRAVGLPPDRVRPLLDAVGRAEDQLNHHARAEQTADGVTFEVWTHSLDRVTDLDVELARRISEAVQTIGSGG